MGYELAEQLDWTLPDWIVYPTGGGTGLVGMWKAFDEMEAIGWIAAGQRPRMVSVQAEGCAPIVRAFDSGAETAGTWENAHTVADGLRVPRAIGDFLILRAIRESGGTAVAVTDAADGRRHDGDRPRRRRLAAPEGAAALSAVRRLVADGTDQAARDRGALQHRRRAEVPRPAPPGLRCPAGLSIAVRPALLDCGFQHSRSPSQNIRRSELGKAAMVRAIPPQRSRISSRPTARKASAWLAVALMMESRSPSDRYVERAFAPRRKPGLISLSAYERRADLAAALHPGDMVITFLVGERHAYAWAFDRHTLIGYPLPPSAEIAAAVERVNAYVAQKDRAGVQRIARRSDARSARSCFWIGSPH